MAQFALWADRINQAVFPLPSTVLARAAGLAANGSFLASTGDTLAAWAEAMAITVAIAVPAGLVLGMLPWAESAVRPVIEFVRPVPPVVLIPLVLLIVQDDVRTEVAVIVYASVWPVLINTVYGLREVDPAARETLRSFGFGPLAVALRVSLPSAAPFIATGIRIAASLAFVVAIAVEFVGVGMNGIGAFVSLSTSASADITLVIAVAIWSGLIGLVLNAIFAGTERRIFRWHYMLAGTSGAPR
jgi:NitT/TauT family transport system permease protein